MLSVMSQTAISRLVASDGEHNRPAGWGGMVSTLDTTKRLKWFAEALD